MQPEVLHEGCFSGKQHQVEEQKDCTDICQHFIKNFELWTLYWEVTPLKSANTTLITTTIVKSFSSHAQTVLKCVGPEEILFTCQQSW